MQLSSFNQVSSFKSAGKLITGHGAAQQLQPYVQSLDMQRPLIVTDSGDKRTIWCIYPSRHFFKQNAYISFFFVTAVDGQ
ncbi:iron-containing alcohol dehydrogenase [Halomonas sp. KO116]|uniref:iron-containing alcohol dehydrogenase n=1 Tax=Halomonas sp. KO116 TaxID=1504981 RepID=UPI0004E44C2A|nr:iron-containing alcohol dehydrogenase [Halomonas sp. KO116]AJY49836.1 hypothetical protein KO116_01347 [Halomonas sp. KO116]